MPTYNYVCNSCEAAETLDQPFGSPRAHTCKCGGTCLRVVTKFKEATMATVTPGGCSETSKETRSANRIMTRIREKQGLAPIDDPNHLAAERHQGRKSGLV